MFSHASVILFTIVLGHCSSLLATRSQTVRSVCILLECILVTTRKLSLGQGNIFTPVCNSVHGGACVVARGCVWLPRGAYMVVRVHMCLLGGMHGLTGVCVWLQGGHVWLPGGMHGCQGGMCDCGGMRGCPGGVHGCPGGMCGCQGACVVVGGCVHGCQGGMCGCGGAYVGYDEIRSVSGRYASYWNAFLFTYIFSWQLNHVFDWLISYWCTRSETRLFIHYISFALTPEIGFYSLLPCFIDVAIFFWPQSLCGSCVCCWVLLRRRLYDNSCQQWDVFISHILRM